MRFGIPGHLPGLVPETPPTTKNLESGTGRAFPVRRTAWLTMRRPSEREPQRGSERKPQRASSARPFSPSDLSGLCCPGRGWRATPLPTPTPGGHTKAGRGVAPAHSAIVTLDLTWDLTLDLTLDGRLHLGPHLGPRRFVQFVHGLNGSTQTSTDRRWGPCDAATLIAPQDTPTSVGTLDGSESTEGGPGAFPGRVMQEGEPEEPRPRPSVRPTWLPVLAPGARSP
jgi:hypothetical protein